MKNKRIAHISNTLSKRHGIFTEHFIILFFFPMQEKPETWRCSNLANSSRPFYGDGINVAFALNKQCL